MTTTFYLKIVSAPSNYSLKITGWFDVNCAKNYTTVLPGFSTSLTGQNTMLSIQADRIYQTDAKGQFEMTIGPFDWEPKNLENQCELRLHLAFNTNGSKNEGAASNGAYYIPTLR